MYLSDYGRIANEEIENTIKFRNKYGVAINKYIVMPNHIHLIIELNKTTDETFVGTRRAVSVSRRNEFSRPIRQSISTIVGAYKSAVTRRINLMGGHGTPCPYEKVDKKQFGNHDFTTT